MRSVRPLAFLCAFFLAAASIQPSFSQSSKSGPIKLPVKETVHALSTLDYLQTAYFTEKHESVLYLEFAKQADKEGYGQVASMFRAVARAEQIHAATKETLIRQLSAIPDAASEPLIVGTTRENLEYAKASETYESDMMYEGAIAQAQKEKNSAAEQAFRFGKAAEPGHVAMFEQALDNLDGYKGANIEFLVCPQCGMTARALGGPACPTCSISRDMFEKVR